MIFECKEHQLFYEALQKQIKDGLYPNIQTVAVQIGLDSHYLNKNKEEPWRIQIRDVFKDAISEWKINGGCPIASKFRIELQNVIDTEEEPIGVVLCQRVGVRDRYLNTSTIHWVKKIKEDFNEARKDWEKYGGKDYKELKYVLKAMIAAGERIFVYYIAVRGGKSKSYFYRQSLLPWQKKILKEIKKAEKQWEDNGGMEYKNLKKILQKVIDSGAQPTRLSICKEANYNEQNFIKSKFVWQDKIKAEIKKAKRDWEQDGGSSYKKCKIALDNIVKEGGLLSPGSVARKAGFTGKFLTKYTMPWKERILNDIENTVSGGLDKVKILFIDVDTLIYKITENEKIDYCRIGISVNHPAVESVDKYSLAHIMYSSHRLVKRPDYANIIFVNHASYCEKNKLYIDGIIRACEGMPYSAMTQYIPKMISIVAWIGDSIPLSINEAKQIFINYSEYLHKMLKSTEIKHSNASHYQHGASKLLAGMFHVDESKIMEDGFSLLIPQKAPRSNAFNNNAKFTQEELGYAFSFYYHLFDQVSDFLLENKSYPYCIQLPRGTALLLGVGGTMIATSYDLPKKGSIAIDYKDGHILTDEEIEAFVLKVPKEKRSRLRSDYKISKTKALKYWLELNGKLNHDKRLHLGKRALDSWFMCMLYLTNANDSTLSSCEWFKDDKYEIEHDERKEFITIKPRAYNKKIRLTIPKVFMSSFKKAIKLRSFVLNGHDFPYLFFTSGYGNQAKRTKNQVNGGMSGKIAHNMIKSIDSKLPRVCSRDSRRDGARDVLKTHGVEVALLVLQNERDTLIRNYNGQTMEEMASELSRLMQDLHNVISGKPIEQKQQSAMGGCGCEGEFKPETFSPESPVEADCFDQKSCIFCIHYITFPEPEEIRKLFSLRYLIENVAYDRTEDEAFYENKMEHWLVRIEAILDAMVEKEPKVEHMIERIRNEVYEEGLLSSYWLEWADLLDELGRFE